VLEIFHKLWVRERPSVIFEALTRKLQFLKLNLNPLSDFQGPVLAHNFATPIYGGE
jgi:hypothetical protein